MVESATAILAQSQQRLEIVAENLANATTPAYKRRIAFSALFQGENGVVLPAPVSPVVDKSPGKLVETGSPFDLAISGPGLFALRDAQGVRYSRQGRFTRNADGHLVDLLGGVLQLANGSDLVVGSADFEVRGDGGVAVRGTVIGRIGVFADGTGPESEAGEAIASAQVQQGAYEASNVTTGDEMVIMMEALRRAEAAQRVMVTYDELLGRAISAFGESAR